LQRQAQLRAEVHGGKEKSSGESHVRISEEARDSGDDSFSNLIVDTNLAEVDRDAEELQRIDAALLRMQEGTYGLCQDCSGTIPVERLLAEPTALRDVACQELYEKTHATAPTPSL
jgi:RNA polymerase-binding transcription factor DksA